MVEPTLGVKERRGEGLRLAKRAADVLEAARASVDHRTRSASEPRADRMDDSLCQTEYAPLA